jgi:hypothetical protein
MREAERPPKTKVEVEIVELVIVEHSGVPPKSRNRHKHTATRSVSFSAILPDMVRLERLCVTPNVPAHGPQSGFGGEYAPIESCPVAAFTGCIVFIEGSAKKDKPFVPRAFSHSASARRKN